MVVTGESMNSKHIRRRLGEQQHSKVQPSSLVPPWTLTAEPAVRSSQQFPHPLHGSVALTR